MKTPTDDLIALVCKSVAEEYEGDVVVPGLVIAHMRAEKSPTGKACFYVCARRYDKCTDEHGNSLAGAIEKVYHEDLDEAVRLVAAAICNPNTEHQRELAAVVKRDGLGAK